MKQRKLISMLDFIFKQDEINGGFGQEEIDKVWEYANFLKQTPKIGMFVPAKEVDGEWVVLEEPIAENYFNVDITIDKFTDEDAKGLNEHYIALLFWEEAKSRVIFEGNFDVSTKGSFSVRFNNVFHILSGFKTVEDLIKYDLQLTEQKAKELGLCDQKQHPNKKQK